MAAPGKKTVSLRELLRGAASSVHVRGADLTPVSPAAPHPRPSEPETPSLRRRSSFFDEHDDSEESSPAPDTRSKTVISSPCPEQMQPRPARAGLSLLSPFLADEEDYLFESKQCGASPLGTITKKRQPSGGDHQLAEAASSEAPALSFSEPRSITRERKRQLVSEEKGPLELDGGCRPGPQQSRSRPLEALPLPGSNGVPGSAVNCHLASCLLDHQVAGVLWLWDKYCLAQGCILGDDMGLGKTVQIIALLSGILRKSGTTADVDANRLRRRGRDSFNLTKPSLIVCPASVIDNWKQELDKWGFFLFESIESSEIKETMARASCRRLEIVLCSYDKMKIYSGELAAVEWEVIVWDEGHCLKNDKMARYEAAVR